MTKDIFIGRQPIYDRNLDVWAYELLYRNCEVNSAEVADGDSATSKVLIGALIDIGLENLVGSRFAFVNFTRGFLVGDYPIPFDPGQFVVEILEDIEVDEELVKSVGRLAKRGYTIALDDFVYEPRMEPLVSLASIVKVDILVHDRDSLREQVAQLREFPVKLLAEKVETQEAFIYCEELGFDYYQGYFLSEPRVVRGQSIPTNKLAVIDLMVKLRDPGIRISDLEEAIRNDVSMSYKLLRYVNSPVFGLSREIDSVGQAILMLGLDYVGKMVTLIALSGLSDKPLALSASALQRARMCEQMARTVGSDHSDDYFTVGLFSTLDALMDVPMNEALSRIPLSDEVRNALVDHSGELGDVLTCVLSYERGDWDKAQLKDLNHKQVRESYYESIRWAEAGMKILEPAESPD